MDSVNIMINMDGVNLKSEQKRTAGQKHGALKEALLREGIALLDVQGIEAVTIRAVARNAGVAHSAPANHFQSRKAMLTAIAAMIFRDLANQSEKAIANVANEPQVAIQAFSETCLQFAFDFPNRYQLLWQRQIIDQDNPDVAIQMERVYSALLLALGENKSDRRVDIETDAIAIWSMIHGYISMRLDGNLVAANDTLTNLPRHKAMLLTLINGINH